MQLKTTVLVMSRRWHVGLLHVFIGVLVIGVAGSPARAQQPPPLPDRSRFASCFGPLTMTTAPLSPPSQLAAELVRPPSYRSLTGYSVRLIWQTPPEATCVAVETMGPGLSGWQYTGTGYVDGIEGVLHNVVFTQGQYCFRAFAGNLVGRSGYSAATCIDIPSDVLPATFPHPLEAALSPQVDPRPCIPENGAPACDAMREALWNGDAAAWAARGITDPDTRFNETVVFRVRAGDPGVISNIARFLQAPYLQITRLRFGGGASGVDDEFVQITNLGGGAQDLGGWSVRAPQRSVVAHLPAGFVLGPGESCRVGSSAPARLLQCGSTSFGLADVWPDTSGEAVLFYDALALLGDETLYQADANNQPPHPNLQRSPE